MPELKVLSPYDEHLIKTVPKHDEAYVMQALDTAHKTYEDRSAWLPAYKRIEILEKLYQLFSSRRDEMAHASAEEGGKPLMDSIVEADRAIQGIKVAIEHIGRMTGTEIPMGITPSSQHRKAFTIRQPVGVVLAISAFNHPMNLIIHQVVPAIAVGCPVLVKPASTTPISCFNVVNMLYEAGLPEEWCKVIMCEPSVAEKVLQDPRISFLSFIGSGRVGWHLRSLLPHGAHCALEHGGAAPAIIAADADLDDALPILMKGGFYHAGQVCVSVQRIFAHSDIVKRLAKSMAKAAEKLVVGDPVDPSTEVGPLISSKEVDRVDEWVKEAVTKGAKLLCGGNKISATCYAPTVLLNPPLDSRVCREEIFGPVVCINSYDKQEQAIAYANALPFAFQAAVFTKAIDVAMDMVNRLEARAVMVNDNTAFRVDWMPFGGRKESGLGVGGIPYSMEDMTYEKMMVLRSATW